MADSEPTIPATSATSANTGNIVALPGQKQRERPSSKVLGFVKRHPVVAVAGGLAVGAAVAALLPRRITRGPAIRAMNLAEAAGTSTALFGKRAGSHIKRLTGRAGDEAHEALYGIEAKAERIGDFTATRLEKLATIALATASSLGKLGGKQAERLEDAASEGTHKALDIAESLRKKLHR
ncbi:hypothetical protein HT136_11790 [Novosphingobium profundi]|uniref:hypothetical protein n=1 Tax=Novosphingobium profundi TaxID=1774954 RepID=UPI001BD9D66E|nr:hypothetical protein [Novosphingobium profundi]MBT0669045.1 hypothetical protein [Novosphingobium profundi]